MQNAQLKQGNPLPQNHVSQRVNLGPIRSVLVAQPQVQHLTSIQKMGCTALAVALTFGLVQAVRCGVESSVKLVALISQNGRVEALHDKAQAQNMHLKDKLALYSTSSAIEEVARERLSLVGPDEILVRFYPATIASTHP